MRPIKFKTLVGDKANKIYYAHVIVPQAIQDKLKKAAVKRVLCYINDQPHFHAGLMPSGNGDYFIILSKARIKALKLEIGQSIDVRLEEDTSKYGMPLSEEFDEILQSDEEGLDLFEKLTDGKKRNLIHLINSTKSTDLRITKGLIILDHLKANAGKIDFKLLNEAMKVKNRKY